MSKKSERRYEVFFLDLLIARVEGRIKDGEDDPWSGYRLSGVKKTSWIECQPMKHTTRMNRR